MSQKHDQAGSLSINLTVDNSGDDDEEDEDTGIDTGYIPYVPLGATSINTALATTLAVASTFSLMVI